MGDSLTHSLINLRQLRAFGMDVQDNPFSTKVLTIQPAPHNITIPLQTLSTIIYGNTHAPTDQELTTRPHIVLSSNTDWDPHHLGFPSLDVEKESKSTISAIQMQQQYAISNICHYSVEPEFHWHNSRPGHVC